MHSKGGAAVSAAPTKLLETSIDWCTFYLAGALETSAPPESYTNKQNTLKGVQLSPLGFAACQSKNCTNKAICEPLLGWCTFCLIGALETSAPPESCTNNTKVQN